MLLAAFVAAFVPATAAFAARADDVARARARGNRRPVAIALATALLREMRPAQITLVRVDGIGSHDVAGIIVSGVKFHRPLDATGFAREIAGIVRAAFAASPIEEVDVWATVPLRLGEKAVVSGDKAESTTRVVYAATVRRDAPGGIAAALRGAFWEPAWKAGLGASRRTQSERVSEVRPR